MRRLPPADDMDRLTALRLDLRRPTLDDAPAMFELLSAVDTHDYGDVDETVNDVRDDLSALDLERDAWLVAADGALVGAATLQDRGGVQWRGHVMVHPEARGQGIGNALAAMVEERARARIGEAPPGERVALIGWLKANDAPRLAWARRLGFEPSRRFLRMRIDLAEPPPEPNWPPGIAVRTFVPGADERAMHAALEDAFSDHWGHVQMLFDEWITRTERHDFDAGLWFLALDGERIVATATNSVIPGDIGWISGLGTVPSHRRRGLARAILLHSFGEFWRRGLRSVALGVDSENLTGATRLYESVGMRVELAFDQVRKVLRAGPS
jgi:mycothiol synthase